MTRRDVLSTAFKTIGVVCFVLAIREIPTLGFLLTKFYRNLFVENILRVLPHLLSPIIYIITAYILLKYSDNIAINLIAEDAELVALAPEQNPKQVFIIALKVVGLVF